MRAPGAISDGPNTLGGRLQTLIDLHMAAVGRLHSCLFEADAARIWRTSSGYQQVCQFVFGFANSSLAQLMLKPVSLCPMALGESV